MGPGGQRGRFAPSPSGRMHLGNALSALLAWLDIRSVGGRLVLRIEDLDPQRTGEPWIALLKEDLLWLGLDWDEGEGIGNLRGPYRQSERTEFYRLAMEKLERLGVVYPCWCSRAERLAASAPHPGEPGERKNCPCRTLTSAQREARGRERPPAWKAAVPDRMVRFQDGNLGRQEFQLAGECGDFILRRSDGVYAYQLAVTVDDALMGVTRVVRGRDLLSSTPWQIWLHHMLGYSPPEYCHVPLLLARDGRRLSKRDRDLDFGALRARYTPEEVVGLLAWLAGVLDRWERISPRELLSAFSWKKVQKEDQFLPSDGTFDN